MSGTFMNPSRSSRPDETQKGPRLDAGGLSLVLGQASCGSSTSSLVRFFSSVITE